MSAKSKITKAVIAAAGFGSRLLPATKATPKELVSLINTPIINYITNQCIDCGITDIIIITKPGNNAIKNYFSQNLELEEYLTQKGKTKELEIVRKIYKSANIRFIDQDETLPYGNARPLYTAKDLIEDGESFVYTSGDDLVFGQDAGISEIVSVYDRTGADMVLMCTPVSDKMIPKVGIVKFSGKQDDIYTVEHIVEKPKLEEAPSNVGAVMCYVFNSKIFDLLDPTYSGTVGEFFIQAAMDQIMKTGDVRACVTKGKWLTNGDPLNYLISSVEVALSRDDVSEDFLDYLKTRIGSKTVKLEVRTVLETVEVEEK